MVTIVPSAAPSLNMLTPGGGFRDYQLLEQIGVGGQAVVWSALSRSQDRIYAIKFNKILESDQTHSEEIGIEQKLERLVRLDHPRILPLQEHGTEQGVRFMISPYIPGGTLAHRIKTSPLSFDQVLKLGTQIASALDYLHREGVIHRDLKSSNILLDLSNHTYLADFGLARLVSSSTLAFHTGHGTPPYAPPEQIRSQEITLKSDIFSFGILLFEMFTGQLPWNNQRQLGVEQLHSQQELPDPREYVTGLPGHITDVLRRVTSADPDKRPRSAGEVMQMLCYVFKVSAESLQDESIHDETAARRHDAEELLRQGLAQWEASRGRFNLGLTGFALIDMQGNHPETDTFNRFMLSQSLTYGHKDARWWAAVGSARDRLIVAATLLGTSNEAIAARIFEHLVHDTAILASPRKLPGSLAISLLSVGLRSKDPVLGQKILAGLRMLVPPGNAWQDSTFPTERIGELGKLALEDSEYGDIAAELIGHLRAPSAVRVILNSAREGRKIDALLLIQQVAGSLPEFVPRGVRLRLSLDWILQRLTQQPLNLIGAYLLAFLGAALGIFLQVYLTIRLPDFFNITRLTTSVERGLITGSVLGLGIFLSRLIVERFNTSGVLRRLFLGTLVGGAILNIGFLIFHILFVRTFPRGFLIMAACLTIALAFAIGGLLRSLAARMILVSLTVFLAIVGTWLIHVNLAPSLLELTPLFKYEYTWSLGQVVVTALAVSLPIAVIGNLIRLELKDEYL